MPRRCLSQRSFFDPEFVMPTCLTEGALPWILARHRSRLLPAWLFKGWRGESGIGRNAWPAPVLMTLCLLRWSEEGVSILAAVRRGRTDLQWRAAMGLNCDVEPPSDRTVRDFERFLSRPHPKVGLPRIMLLHEHVVRLCLEEGVVGDAAVWATDSTPMWCYGAVLDTVRLLGDGLRQLGRCWARATRASLADVAADWDCPLLLAKSTKGALGIDWRDPEQRAGATNDLAEQVVQTAQWIRRRLSTARAGFHRGLLRRCRNLLRVVEDDLEPDDEGRLVIARRVARDRLISITDPEARHGRKSKRRLFKGYKLHVVGDLVSGLIASVCVSPGSDHDGAPTHRLIGRAKRLAEDISQVLGDSAYGGTRLGKKVRDDHGVTLAAPPAAVRKGVDARLGKDDFDIDFDTGRVTCPAGITTEEFWLKQHAESGMETRVYKWRKEDCSACPLRARCCGKGRSGRRLLLHPLEHELRERRASWKKPETKAMYRRRAEFERLIHQMTRHGGRKARSWGLTAANRQAHAISTACNLHLLAQALANKEATVAAA